MSWLHCMWGIGATVGPYLMGYTLSGGQGWNAGYRYIGILQLVLTAVLLFSLPLWKGRAAGPRKSEAATGKALALKKILKIPGVKEVMVCFFCYCAVEQTTILWASSYLTLYKGVSAETAAGFASVFFIGITVGRALCGFITMKLNDTKMIRLGQVLIVIGIVAMLLPGPQIISLLGLSFVGLGCAPIYPSIIHATPDHFGADQSQAVIGVQMASAYVGTCLMPPLFGMIANHFTVALLPVYLLMVLVFMVIMHELLTKKAPISTIQRD